MMRVVLDTNILISGVLHIGKPSKILDLALQNRIEIVASVQIIDEFKEVIARDKFRLSSEEQEIFTNFIIRLCRIVAVKSIFKVVKDDPDDDVIVRTAYDSKVDYIVSGDRHILDLGAFAGIKIVRASELLKILEEFSYGGM
jgi:putative PIN family toxin of toxin-antitoxin system